MAMITCPICNGNTTIPIGTPTEAGDFYKPRLPDHARGSEWCYNCGGAGEVDDAAPIADDPLPDPP